QTVDDSQAKQPPVIANSDDVVSFEVVSCEGPILQRGMEQTRDVKYGFEGGRIVKIDGVYHWITAEMAGDPMNVNMKIAHWTSRNGTDWQRQSTLFQSDGDFTGVSQRAAVWGPMPVFMEDEDRWHLFYVCYKSKPNKNGMFYANHHGVIQHAVSDIKGRNGIGGPYTDRGILMRYDGGNPDPWEGLQGTDSFFPYKVGKKWYALYGSATTQYPGGDKRRKWQVGLAQADKIDGQWTRMSELNPVSFVDFAENPIVMELQKGIYIAIVDGGPKINKLGFSLSTDGLKWTPLKHFELEPIVKKWWRTMRTPLSLIKEDDGTYTMFFTAFKDDKGQPTFGTLNKVTLKAKYAPTTK
ncbi:MAG: hypothetical protein LBK06_06615, partial [Planctomycetaceae bacterium]|nr:hypothetical protein [Planctomycetaceae bacterium]